MMVSFKRKVMGITRKLVKLIMIQRQYHNNATIVNTPEKFVGSDYYSYNIEIEKL